MLLDLDSLAHAALGRDPFFYTVVPNFIRLADAAAIREDFPAIADPGLLPVEATLYGHRFGALIRELQSPAVARAFSEKFAIDLAGRPTMITVRGRCQAKDGRIHPDSEAKLVTALLYFNETWENQGGRLRLLRSATDLNDVIAEVPPAGGVQAFGLLISWPRALCGRAALCDDQLDGQRVRGAARIDAPSAFGPGEAAHAQRRGACMTRPA
jgi:hypothetical protein